MHNHTMEFHEVDESDRDETADNWVHRPKERIAVVGERRKEPLMVVHRRYDVSDEEVGLRVRAASEERVYQLHCLVS